MSLTEDLKKLEEIEDVFSSPYVLLFSHRKKVFYAVGLDRSPTDVDVLKYGSKADRHHPGDWEYTIAVGPSYTQITQN